jgi:hypothetical protein
MKKQTIITLIRSYKYCSLLLLFMIIFPETNAQDTHYNTVQFGARSALMGGAVVGNVKDNTAVFYNPAGMGFIDSSTLSINGNAYQIQNIRIFNAIGERKDFKSSSLGSVPLFVGGMFTKAQKKLKIGYSIMSSVNFNFKATARIDENLDIVDDAESPGTEEFIGQASIDTRLSELVIGVGGGYRLNDKWSVGLSNLFYIRSLSFNRSTYSRFFLNETGSPLVSTSFVRNADYFNVRYAAKLGVNYQDQNFSAGLTVTTPSLGLFGSGTIAADVIGNNIKYKGARTSLLANDRQEKLKSTYKSPLAVTAGINWTIHRSSFGIAVQYYGSTAIYDVLKAKPSAFIRPADLNTSLGGSDEFLRLKEAAKSVFNFAIGYEYLLKPDVILSASLRTDQSYFDKAVNKSVGLKSAVATWGIYHFSAGSTFTRGRSKMSVGLLYSKGSDDSREQNGNLENPNEGNFLQGSTTITKATYSSIGLLLGYTFAFKKY